VKKKMKERKI